MSSFTNYPSSGPDIGTVLDLTPQAAAGTQPHAVHGSLKRLYDRMRSLDRMTAGVASPLRGTIGADNANVMTVGLSNGTDTACNSRLGQYARRPLSALRVIAPNFYSSEPNTGGGTITVRASIEYPSGTFTPVYFGDVRDAVVVPGGIACSDTVSVNVPSGALFWTRTYVTVAPGAKFPVGKHVTADGNSRSHGSEIGAAGTVTDKTTTGTLGGEYAYRYSGFAVSAGRPSGPSVAFVGDSIAGGGNDGGAEGMFKAGFLVRSFTPAGVPWLDLSTPSERASSVITRKLAWAAACTHAVVQYGTNDLSAGDSVATLQANLVGVWARLANMGVTAYQTTITPNSTSTDSFATVANQTPTASYANRTATNDWIRDGAPLLGGVAVATGSSAVGTVRAGNAAHPLAGYIEIADTVESARNSGRWKAAISDDGTHPGTSGHVLMATAITAAINAGSFA